MVDGVLERERLQAALLTDGGVQRPPHLRSALWLSISGRDFGLVWCRLRCERVGVGVGNRGNGMSDGGLRANPAEMGRGLVVWRGPRVAVEALSVLQVNQRDAATVGQQRVALLLVGEAGVVGGMLLRQQGALTPNWCLQTANLAAAAGSET